MKREEKIYQQIARYMKREHPKALFRFDVGAGMKISIGQAVINKSMGLVRGYPDLFIAEPRGKFHGLYIEVKVNSPFKQNGELKKTERLQEQSEMLGKLTSRGYYATFGVGVEDCERLIYGYLKITNHVQINGN